MTQHTLTDLKENFALFDDWNGRYEYLIDLGRKLAPMDDLLKTEETEVKGCVSKVWLYIQQDEVGRFQLQADSDGSITKGLVYIVLAAYQGKTVEEIQAIDIHNLFSEIGLEEHLSPNRRNGFFAMVEKIKSLAA
jgi:cysteine desulfuration protein SufE